MRFIRPHRHMTSPLSCRSLQPWTARGTLGSLWTVISPCRRVADPLCRSVLLAAPAIRQVVRSMTVDAVKTLLSTRSSRLVNSLLYGICSGVYRPYTTLLHAWSLTPEGVATLLRACSNCTCEAYQCDSEEWSLSSLSWFTRRSAPGIAVSVRRLTARCHHRGAVNFDHQTISTVLVHVLEIELPDHAFGMVFPHMCVGLILVLGPWTPFTEN